MRSVRNENPDDKFVCLLKANSCLWDPNHKDYKNTAVRQRAWKYVAERASWSVPKCRNKYKELRDKYRNEIRGKRAVNGGESVAKQLDFLRKSFKNLPIVSTTTASKDLNVHVNSSVRSLRSTPCIQQSDQTVVDPLFLDMDQLSNASLKIEDFPSDLASLRILDPTEVFVNGSKEVPEKNEEFDEMPLVCPLRTKGARKETDEARIPAVVPQSSQQSYQPSGFALAIDEKLKLLPPRERNLLEKKIFVLVADEVDKIFQ
ncbi:uncharacterized protein LOC129797558 [Lutzomyia longipalpis]|uniref:uncharacterized protein LOC129797558 n=1 Tax=Lutzomyia longipalpis TaxID=7200 RepID=UPI0024834C47|nr:uncharacterized protein LOC129797558 [Lutzomyia longipalpis]